MYLYVLFGQRKESHEGEYAPEALLCWEEYSVDENPDGWEEALDEAQKKNASEMIAMRVLKVKVDADKIRKLLLGTPVVVGEISESPA